MEKTIIRDAVTEDIEQLINIYAYYVRNTAVTFDYEIPSYPQLPSRKQHVS